MAQPERVKSADRVLLLLELFEKKRTPMSASQVSSETGWPLSSTAALLKSLAHSRYLTIVENGKSYFPSIRLHNLTRWLGAELFAGGDSVQDLMIAMRERFGETVTLSVRRGLAMEFVQILLGTKRVVMKVKEGDHFHVLSSAIGVAALAATDDAKTAVLLERARRIGDGPVVDTDVLNRQIAMCRKQGFYAGYDQVIEGLGAVSLPLTRPGSVSTYVLAVAGLASQIRRQEQEIAQAALAMIGEYRVHESEAS